MGQPLFIQKIDGSNPNASSLTLTMTTTAGNGLLVGVILNTNGSQSSQSVAAITDSAGSVSGVPVNRWIALGNSTNAGIRIEWWACKGAVSITNLVIHLTGLQSIIAFESEYSSMNGITTPNFQPLQANQNTITSLHIHETASTFPNSGAELMIGLFAMLSDTFNATPLAGTNRSTNSFSIPPALSYQVLEQATVDSTGLLNVNAVSATQLASAFNVANSSMQCLYILISGGLILNTQPGFSDQPDSTLAAGNYAIGNQMAKISGNAALGMVRLEFFQGVYTNGQTVNLPVSPVDGYQYQLSELLFSWAVYNTADLNNGWISAANMALWYANWNVDPLTGKVTSEEWYRNNYASQFSNDGHLQVFIIAQRQKVALTAAVAPTWTQQQASQFVTDYAYATDVLVALNNNAKMAVLGQECIAMGEFYHGQTVPTPVSPADGHSYAYSEVTFLFSWRWTTGQTAYVQPAWTPYYNLASLHALIGATGAVTCAVGWMGNGGQNYTELTTYGRIAVFALCQRTKTGTPAVVANKFAEIPNSLFYPGNDLPAGIGQQLFNNIQEAALSPEFFGPTLYAPGSTIPLPTSPVDSYQYSRSELTYIWDWGQMITGNYPGSGGDNDRCALFSANINQSTGVVTDVLWRLAPGGPYVQSTIYGHLSVVVCGFRSTQQTATATPGVNAPSDAGSTVVDQGTPGSITVNGV
jgi:hypothetical protein